MQDPSSAYKVTGGARIGLVNFTWPLASLTATADRLTITTTLFGLFDMGTYSFSKDQVSSIERYVGFPFVGEGIRIHHSVAEYPEKIVFWCRPASVLAGITGTGFSPSHDSSVVPDRKSPRGFPLRWTPLVALAVIWNLLIGSEMLSNKGGSPLPGPLSLVALGIVFGVSIAAIRFPQVQAILLKPGRQFGEVKPIFLLVAAVSGIMAAVFGIIFALS